MDLILWRHAEAEEARGGVADLDRRLTSKGERQAEQMARWLRHQLPRSARILASPARRTQQTAAALEREVETRPELQPGCHAQALLTVAGWPDTLEPVLVVGHQPTLGDAAALLLGARQPSLAVRKGSIWWFKGRVRDGRSEVTLHAVLPPDLA